VRPAWLARSTASEDGAETAASTGIPAITAFCVSSKEARPLTSSTVPDSGIRSFSTAQPMTLSTALCLPMSSRTTSMVPSASNSAAPCRPPVLANTRCDLRRWSGIAVSASAVTTVGSSPGE
jgi:hypothetical protein